MNEIPDLGDYACQHGSKSSNECEQCKSLRAQIESALDSVQDEMIKDMAKELANDTKQVGLAKAIENLMINASGFRIILQQISTGYTELVRAILDSDSVDEIHVCAATCVVNTVSLSDPELDIVPAKLFEDIHELCLKKGVYDKVRSARLNQGRRGASFFGGISGR